MLNISYGVRGGSFRMAYVFISDPYLNETTDVYGALIVCEGCGIRISQCGRLIS